MPQPQILDALLSAYWLRPEQAMWRAIDFRAMASFEMESPSLDLGCGEGTFAFLRAGGEFQNGYDVFQATTGLNRFFEAIDVYDAFDESAVSQIAVKPSYQIDVGFDHKENLLKKAAMLGVYKSFKLGDGNDRLPFDDNSFASIFSNVVYWLDDPQAVLSEIERILKPGGKACLMLPNDTLREFSFFNRLAAGGNPDWAFLEQLDRGRLSENIKHAKPAAEWEAMFSVSGLAVHEHVQHLSKTAIQIWDIGMRPLFPVLMKMVASIKPEELPAIKREWIATMKHFLLPIVEMDFALHQNEEPAFHCYTLIKA